MPDSYNNFRCLMEQDGEAKRFYASLPCKVKQAVSSHSENIDSFEHLRDYAESFLNHEE